MSRSAQQQAFKYLLEKHIAEKMDDPVGSYLLGILRAEENVFEEPAQAVVAVAVRPVARVNGKEATKRAIAHLQQTNPQLAEQFFPSQNPAITPGNPYAKFPEDRLCQEWEYMREYLLYCWSKGAPIVIKECQQVIGAAPQTITKWIAQIRELEGK